MKFCLILFIVGVFGFFVYNALTKYETKKNEQSPQKVNLPVSPTPESVSLTPPSPQLSIDDPNSIWIVVNKKRPLPTTFVPSDLKHINEGKQIRSEAATAFQKMIKAAEQDGQSFKIISAYRSYSDQVDVYNGWVKRDGQVKADTYSARPGYSEHQTGLAVDLGNVNGMCDLDICFADMPLGKWLSVHAYRYGFIIRFPSNKIHITGYQYEPWHIRYVGAYLAEKLQDTHQTMEEYLGLLAAPSY